LACVKPQAGPEWLLNLPQVLRPLTAASTNARSGHVIGRFRKIDLSMLRDKICLPALPLTAQCLEEPSAKRLFVRLSFESTQIEGRHHVPTLQLFESLRQARDHMEELAAQSIPSKEDRPCCFFSAK
jgi:hypothetical protein